MKPVNVKIIIILILSILEVNAQNNFAKSMFGLQQKESAKIVFQEIQKGFNSNDISKIAKFIKDDTFINLKNGVSDYFSSSQAYYVLNEFFKAYHTVSVKLDNIKVKNEYSYASGKLIYKRSGVSGTAQVFISLRKTRVGWIIIQLTVS
ncbi:hypothetical protein BMS3Abin04_01429 [bacterium BMS3Abin04]|nr:hypothetical protein BMS3Abin04_01429 [bacterium BMS3Abin04]